MHYPGQGMWMRSRVRPSPSLTRQLACHRTRGVGPLAKHLPQLQHKGTECKRLVDEGYSRQKYAPGDERFVGVARHVNGKQIWIAAFELVGKFRAVHTRHNDIG